ncbi:hypothetical protein NST50_14225 [Paenibacillus sp. FSL E2-0202]|uniref:hypothetical protein n=1 Tax=Paenibacillus sp. FSL E2-0202 TaxID=2954505 RepID=UPI0030EEE153
MVVIKKLELSLDLTRPTEELIQTIITLLEFFPGQQLEILQQVDHRVGEMLAALQKSQQEPEEKVAGG